jgi:methyltransferase family protein
MNGSASDTGFESGLRIRGDEDTQDAANHRKRYQWAARMLDGAERILDFGAGTGYGSKILARTGAQVTGHDPPMGLVAALEPGLYDAVVAFEVLEHLEAPPLGTLMALERLAPIVIASVPYLERAGRNDHHRWYRLQESTFPARQYAYQFADGTITAMPGHAPTLIVCTFPWMPIHR